MNNLYVIKAGSSTLFSNSNFFSEVINISRAGGKVLVVCGGADAIQQEYMKQQTEIDYLQLAKGGEVRYCSARHMQLIVKAYNEYVAGKIKEAASQLDFSYYFQISGDHELVTGVVGKPLKVIEAGKKRIVRDSLYGTYHSVKKKVLHALIESYDVVFLSPPIWSSGLQQYINIDADMLAAHLAVEMSANHLRFVTSTRGILRDVNDQHSTIKDIYIDDDIPAHGRMKQKVRACKLALQQGVCDISINGPHSLYADATWFWRGTGVNEQMHLLNMMVNISSISGDESVLTRFIKNKVVDPDISSLIDPAGNLVLSKGDGPHTLLLLGHLDTVPGLWRSEANQDYVSGRGSVDAKGCMANFIAVIKEIIVPAHARLMVVGATEEEVSSSKGAYYVRDHYPADAVIIGEPSGIMHAVIGYYGLLKIAITARKDIKHTAARDGRTSIERVYDVVNDLRMIINDFDNNNISNIITITHNHYASYEESQLVINFRVSPEASDGYLERMTSLTGDDITIEVLRSTPGYKSSRSNPLYRSLSQAFSRVLPDNFLKPVVKKGTSDINTLATTWRNIPFIAYGPGDSVLDHTDQEINYTEDVLVSRKILKETINNWMSYYQGEENGVGE
ncbi:acetylglutamate kinase [Prodigiosinella confusarubida]|uniref:Acetylglutamate kinase n=1 Tax=Serratia sp. (strain ATCC 39006) TaxID=104623 RepID=A0A2I5TIB3_SERS3|nr:M20/M25/M40 family metallo-hydrolase [Serratia sp. ATCC 39006]AUG99981.1 acetylglutamate kinase [Serratia sp. ATCC 39006]AUH04301.1 acetylglutamate kinase [Serratia sp. ATCC 39006]